jgi:hypothetical protein
LHDGAAIVAVFAMKRGRPKLIGISKRGDKQVRTLLVLCARSYITHLNSNSGELADWVRVLMARRHVNVVACALANKIARIAWAIATQQTVFKVQEISICKAANGT